MGTTKKIIKYRYVQMGTKNVFKLEHINRYFTCTWNIALLNDENTQLAILTCTWNITLLMIKTHKFYFENEFGFDHRKKGSGALRSGAQGVRAQGNGALWSGALAVRAQGERCTMVRCTRGTCTFSYLIKLSLPLISIEPRYIYEIDRNFFNPNRQTFNLSFS